MQPKICRVLFSNLLRKFSHLPKSPVAESFPSVLPLAHFSTIPSRPMRGDRRRDDGSEGDFLRNLNFGGAERDRDDAENPHQNPPSRLPNRPLRGDQRPIRRERRDRDDRFHQNLKGASPDFQGLRKTNEARIDGSLKIGDREKKRDQSGDTFFDKLNFGGMGSQKRVEETHTNTSAQVPGTDRLVLETPVPESPPEDADEIFKKMKETGLIPNAVAMLDGLCKDGLVQEAMKLFGLMREKGTIPEVVIYTAVVEGFCKAAKFDDAKRIFQKMQKNGIVPNAFSYAVVIQGLCKGKRLEDAVEFCMEMLDAGHLPNAATLAGLVNEFCNEKGGEEAEAFVRSLREKGFAIDEKAVREHLDRKGPYSLIVWEAIFGKKNSQRAF